MLKLEFTPEVIEVLRHERFHHPHPHVQLKLEVLYLKSQGLAGDHIQRLCAISKATYYRYLAEYGKGGLAQLKEVPVSARESVLQEYRGTLEAYFLAHPPATVAAAQAKLAELTGIMRGPTQVRQFLHALGMKPRKVGTIPAKADVEAQEAFKKKSGAALSRSPSGRAPGLLYGRSALCVRGVSGDALVRATAVCQNTIGPSTLECLGRPERHHARHLHRPESDVYHRCHRL